MFAQIEKSGLTDEEGLRVLYKNYQPTPPASQYDDLQYGKKKKALDSYIAQLEAEAEQVVQRLDQSKVGTGSPVQDDDDSLQGVMYGASPSRPLAGDYLANVTEQSVE